MVESENGARVCQRVREIDDVTVELDRGLDERGRPRLERASRVDDDITLMKNGSHACAVLDVETHLAMRVRSHDRRDPDLREAARDHAAEESVAYDQKAPPRRV